ncbi:hypothetical protein JY412_04080 [Stenotrophomonas maltophilia]|nr:hypothetical protein [Stenotrophomonas maltophilia]
MASKFGSQVRAFTEKAKAMQGVIFRESATKLMEEAGTPEGQGGEMPVDTGFLRSSAAASVEGMSSDSAQAPEVVFATLELGQTVWAGWTAKYAMRMEHGFQGEDCLGRTYAQAGKGFAREAAQRWDFIVAEVTADVKGRMG